MKVFSIDFKKDLPLVDILLFSTSFVQDVLSHSGQSGCYGDSHLPACVL